MKFTFDEGSFQMSEGYIFKNQPGPFAKTLRTCIFANSSPLALKTYSDNRKFSSSIVNYFVPSKGCIPTAKLPKNGKAKSCASFIFIGS